MRYFINTNIARHFRHVLFKNGIHRIHLPAYMSSRNLHSIYIAKPLHWTDSHYFKHALISGITACLYEYGACPPTPLPLPCSTASAQAILGLYSTIMQTSCHLQVSWQARLASPPRRWRREHTKLEPRFHLSFHTSEWRWCYSPLLQWS